MIFALDLIMLSDENAAFFTFKYKTFFLFLVMEAIVLGSALLANALFLFARHFMIQQTNVYLKTSAHHAESDFLECRQIEIGLLSAWVTQLCASIFLLIHKAFFPDLTMLELSPEWKQFLYLITGLEGL